MTYLSKRQMQIRLSFIVHYDDCLKLKYVYDNKLFVFTSYLVFFPLGRFCPFAGAYVEVKIKGFN